MLAVDLALLDQGDQLLGDLLHQNTVVALSGHTGVGEGNELAKAVDRQVALATAALAAGGGDLLGVPGDQGLDHAAEADNLIGVGGVLLQRSSSPPFLAVVQANVQADSLGEQGQQSLLLELVDHDGSVTKFVSKEHNRKVSKSIRQSSFLLSGSSGNDNKNIPLALGSNAETAVSIAESDSQADLGATLAERSNGKTSGQQLVGDLEETTAAVGDDRGELSVARDIRVLVEDVLGRDADMVEEQLAVVDTVASKLVAHVLDTDALGGGHVLLTDADQDRVDALVLTANKGLRKDNTPLGVNSGLKVVFVNNERFSLLQSIEH